MKKKPEQIKPSWVIFKEDVTSFCNKDFLKEKGIDAVHWYGLCDLNLAVHIASLTASAEVWWIYTDVVYSPDVEEPDGDTFGLSPDEIVDYMGFDGVLSKPKMEAQDLFDHFLKEEWNQEDEGTDLRRKFAEYVMEEWHKNPKTLLVAPFG